MKDFVGAVPGSSGERLACWLQPDRRLDPNKCELKTISEPVRYGWPTHLTIITRDQYGDPVYVPNLKVCSNETIMNFSCVLTIFIVDKIDSNKSDTIHKWAEWKSKGEEALASRRECL